mmetsp:Transcript_32972/g.38180  ORF Transcript_32972/g.38180 Transcript_32972/m.38180 type:complete len:296 (+) Transcript_32972:46-933(+)
MSDKFRDASCNPEESYIKPKASNITDDRTELKDSTVSRTSNNGRVDSRTYDERQHRHHREGQPSRALRKKHDDDYRKHNNTKEEKCDETKSKKYSRENSYSSSHRERPSLSLQKTCEAAGEDCGKKKESSRSYRSKSNRRSRRRSRSLSQSDSSSDESSSSCSSRDSSYSERASHQRRKDSRRRSSHKKSKKSRSRKRSSDDHYRKKKSRKKDKRNSSSHRKKRHYDGDFGKEKGSIVSNIHDSTSSDSSSSGGDNVRRSVISGKKIKMHIDKTADDLFREKARKDLLRFMNSSV